MSDNQTKEEFDTKCARRSCFIVHSSFLSLLVAVLFSFCLLIFTSCHREPDLSDYHLSGETIVLSGEKFDYHITYESLSVKNTPETGSNANVIKLSVSIDEGVEIPKVLYFYTTNDIFRIESNGVEGAIYKKLPVAGGRMEISVGTNLCEVDLYYYHDDFKGYIKFGLTKLTIKQDLYEDASVEAIEIDLY